MANTIDAYGDPLAFEVSRAARPRSVLQAGDGRHVFKVEARQLAHHQKEAIATEGEHGSAWRLSSDEGTHLRGTDLAPFPLGFFNAGLQSDFYGRLRDVGHRHNVAFDEIQIRLVNHYWLTGSFIQGTGEGHAESPKMDVHMRTGVDSDTVAALVRAAFDASPAMALLRRPLKNTFALYINGRRRIVDSVASSSRTDVVDPYQAYPNPPRPLGDAGQWRDLIEKTGKREDGTPKPAAPSTTSRVIRDIFGVGRSIKGGRYEVDTWLGLPGSSHFTFRTDEGAENAAPCGLTLLSTGIAFCYMTQLSRYIENMKLRIRGIRLVQFNPYIIGQRATAEPIDTHLFLNGEAPEEQHMKLLTIAARTCYLHATAATTLQPSVRVFHNGSPVVWTT